MVEARHHDRGGVVAGPAQLLDGVVRHAPGQKLPRIFDD
jgi:hypothetical protein